MAESAPGGSAGGETGPVSGGLGGAVGEVAPYDPPPGQRLAFEIAYSNFAWGVQITGTYVTLAGEVYRYDLYGDTPPPGNDPTISEVLQYRDQMTEPEIAAKYGSSPELVGTIPTEEVLALLGYLELARSGVLLSQTQCADYGTRQYVAWSYDSEAAVYSPVLLGVDGDWARRSTAPEAEHILGRLAELLDVSRECAYGEIEPSTCTECADGYDCVVDAEGSEHCEWLYCPETPSTETTCECQYFTLCAGGRSWCQGSDADGFRCVEPTN